MNVYLQRCQRQQHIYALSSQDECLTLDPGRRRLLASSVVCRNRLTDSDTNTTLHFLVSSFFCTGYVDEDSLIDYDDMVEVAEMEFDFVDFEGFIVEDGDDLEAVCRRLSTLVFS
jgi:hypothetical protein